VSIGACQAVKRRLQTARSARATCGLPCGLGAHRRLLRELLSQRRPAERVGAYDELAAENGGYLRSLATSGFVQIVGGCCGTTPDHIKAIADGVAVAARTSQPRTSPPTRMTAAPRHLAQFSGLEGAHHRPE